MLSKGKNGIIVYKGKSLIDGKNIVAIATKDSSNSKTGDLIQIWIIRGDINPILAKRLGEDKSICGDCKHRDFGTCYVNLGHGPNQIFKAYHNDSYEKLSFENMDFFLNKDIRIGAYGDPSAIPIEIINKLNLMANSILGYTHQWKQDKFQGWSKYCMASVETEKEYYHAQALQWRTFRIRLEGEVILENEMVCPASKEAGYKSNCDKCKGCGGLGSLIKKSVVIIFHSNGLKDYRYNRYVKGIKALKNKKKYRVNFDKRMQTIKELCKI